MPSEITPQLALWCNDYVDSQYNSYDGFVDKGEKANAYNGKPGTDVLTLSMSITSGNQ